MAQVQERGKAVASTVQFPLDPDGYKLLSEIGVGERSVVHKAICESANSEVVAVKIIDLAGTKVEGDKFFSSNANALSFLRQDNILSPHCAFLVDRQLWVVMPFVHPGPLQSVVASRYPRGVFEQFLAIILRKILCALLHLHKLGHICRDLKASNIFVDVEGAVKLSDVGLSASFVDPPFQSADDYSVPYWIPPEVIRSENGYSSKSDIWSFGTLALELAYGCPPTSDKKTIKSLLLKFSRRFQYSWNIVKLVGDNIGYRTFTPEFKDFVTSCLVKDPSNRPSVSDLLSHPFIEKNAGSNSLFDNITADMTGIDARFGENKRRLISLMKNNNGDNGESTSVIPKILGWNFNSFIFEFEPDEESTGKKVRFAGEIIIPSEASGSEPKKSLYDVLAKHQGVIISGDTIKKEVMIDFLTALVSQIDEQRETIAAAVAQMGGHLEREEEMGKEIERLKTELAEEKDKSFQLELDLEVLRLRLPGSEGDEQYYVDDVSEFESRLSMASTPRLSTTSSESEFHSRPSPFRDPPTGR